MDYFPMDLADGVGFPGEFFGDDEIMMEGFDLERFIDFAQQDPARPRQEQQQDEHLQQAEQELAPQHLERPVQDPATGDGDDNCDDDDDDDDDAGRRGECFRAVVAILPDICPEYLKRVASERGFHADSVIDHILDQGEQGNRYPQRARDANPRKRKRSLDMGEILGNPRDLTEDEIAAIQKRYENRASEARGRSSKYKDKVRKALAQDFPLATCKFIQDSMSKNDFSLLKTYLALRDIVNGTANDSTTGFKPKKTRTVENADFHPENLDAVIQNTPDGEDKEMLEELKAARQIAQSQDAKDAKEREEERAEEENVQKAMAGGTMGECGCCFGDYPLNRMACCNGTPEHTFCWDCARKNAETMVGLGKYELSCMSTDGCSGGFSMSQRRLFLDAKLTVSLDRIEQEAVLRLAGIDNLASCPFCPYAAEYPPVEEDREFRCDNPDCKMVTCRLCQRESHIPKTCQEAAEDNGLSARRQVEEAMSAALIRRCNKCNTPFIKENGCNKMTCSSAYCGNIQCYICSKNCDYSHFDDRARGGKSGNCPLFDKHYSIDDRHEREVKEAEEKARKAVLEQHPELDEEVLKIKMSEAVKKAKEKSNNHYGGLPEELYRLMRGQEQAMENAYPVAGRGHGRGPGLAGPMFEGYEEPGHIPFPHFGLPQFPVAAPPAAANFGHAIPPMPPLNPYRHQPIQYQGPGLVGPQAPPAPPAGAGRRDLQHRAEPDGQPNAARRAALPPYIMPGVQNHGDPEVAEYIDAIVRERLNVLQAPVHAPSGRDKASNAPNVPNMPNMPNAPKPTNVAPPPNLRQQRGGTIVSRGAAAAAAAQRLRDRLEAFPTPGEGQAAAENPFLKRQQLELAANRDKIIALRERYRRGRFAAPLAQNPEPELKDRGELLARLAAHSPQPPPPPPPQAGPRPQRYPQRRRPSPQPQEPQQPQRAPQPEAPRSVLRPPISNLRERHSAPTLSAATRVGPQNTPPAGQKNAGLGGAQQWAEQPGEILDHLGKAIEVINPAGVGGRRKTDRQQEWKPGNSRNLPIVIDDAPPRNGSEANALIVIDDDDDDDDDGDEDNNDDDDKSSYDDYDGYDEDNFVDLDRNGVPGPWMIARMGNDNPAQRGYNQGGGGYFGRGGGMHD